MAGQMWRVVALYRIVTLAWAAALIVRDHDSYVHPAVGFLMLAIMVAWTPVTIYCYSRPAWRLPWLIAADVAVAAGLVLSTRLVESAARINSGAPTLPEFWAGAPVLACAIAGGPLAGLAGAAVISLADLAERGGPSESAFGSAVLLLIVGGVGGYLVQLGLRAEAAVASAARHEAAMAERERIARGIHDSVLQVLALVSRRGQDLGGEAAELGRLAAEQEGALRSLVSQPAISGPPGGHLDLRALHLPDLPGAELIRRLLALDASIRVLVLSASGERQDVLDAMTAGATGYLVKSARLSELLAAVRSVAMGDPVFTPGLAGLVLGEYRRLAAGGSGPAEDGTAEGGTAGPAPGVPRLTTRETEVLKLIATGLTYPQIAGRLVLSPRTVQNHVQNTLVKLQLHNKAQLVRYALEQGLD